MSMPGGSVNTAVVCTSSTDPISEKPCGTGFGGTARVVIVVVPADVTTPDSVAPPGDDVPPFTGATTVAVPTLAGVKPSGVAVGTGTAVLVAVDVAVDVDVIVFVRVGVLV